MRAGDVRLGTVTDHERPLRIAPAALEREREQVRRRLADDHGFTSGCGLDRGEDRARSGEEAVLCRIRRVAVRADERHAGACDVRCASQIVERQPRVPRDDQRIDRHRVLRGREPGRPQQLSERGRPEHVDARSAFEAEPAQVRDDGVRGRDDVPRRRRDVHPHELRRVVASRPRRVVRDEDHALVRGAQRVDRFGGSGHRQIAAPHHPVQVDEEPVEPLRERHRSPDGSPSVGGSGSRNAAA